jgi:opacity protein-like surface antigen
MKSLAITIACTTLAALAGLHVQRGHATGASFVDGYYVADAEVAGGNADFDDGDGFGLKARAMLGDNLFLTGEYMNNEYEPFDLTFVDGLLGGSRTERFEIEVETFRAGLGIHMPESPVYLRGEYVGYEAEISTTGSESDERVAGNADREDGFAVHLGTMGRLGERVWLHGEAGFLNINDVGEGVELLGGLGFDFTPGFGVFADYRYSNLSERNDDLEFRDARVGLRMSFM